MKKNLIKTFLLGFALVWGECESQTKPIQSPIYKQKALSVEIRTADLLSKMTLDEKIGQMTQLCASSITLDGTKKLDLNLDKIREYITKNHIGSFLSGTGKAGKWVEFVEGIQKVAVSETRLGIPVLFGMDNVHGSNYTDEGTMLPHNLTLGCSFNPALAEDAAKVTAIESADLGHIWNFAPVLDVGKNPYWPRLYETFGEDALVCGTMGSAFIKGFQNCPEVAPYQLAACAKHFIGYSDPKSGWDRTPSEIPDQVLYETFVPPFKMAFDAGVKTLMVNSGELNGEPVHGSKKLLTGLLRNKLGFQGVILTDIKDIFKMVEMHGAYENEKEATLAAIQAGIDMSMACSNIEFCTLLKQLVKDGKITEERINESVRRILRLKFELGLFENPYPQKTRLSKIGAKENYAKALMVAEQSLVLLKNEGNLLPLKIGKQKLMLAGMGANSKRMMNGAWTLEWLGAEESRQPSGTKTLFEAFKVSFPEKTIEFTDSIGWDFPSQPEKETNFLQKFKESQKDADVLVLALGEQPYSEFKGNMNDLSISPAQRKLLDFSISTGKPLILILLEGRPRVLPDLGGKQVAVLFAGHPGTAGAEAIVNVISGKVNPSGKLCFTFPSSVGHFVPYNHKKSEKYQPAYPFGHGLHYGSVRYSNLAVIDSVVSVSDKVRIKVNVENQSKLPVNETILVFNQDEAGTITRPVSKLALFQKCGLQPGEIKQMTFDIPAIDLCSFPNEKGEQIVEGGFHVLSIGDQRIRFKIKDSGTGR